MALPGLAVPLYPAGMRHCALVTVLAILPALGPAFADPVDDLAASWCAAVSARDEAMATALMSPDLQQAVALARIANAAFQTAHPGEKPPLGDGLRLTAFPDGIDTCTPAAQPDGTVRLTMQPAGSAEGAWFDEMIPVAGPSGARVVGDIRFSGEAGDSLSLWLKDAATAP